MERIKPTPSGVTGADVEILRGLVLGAVLRRIGHDWYCGDEVFDPGRIERLISLGLVSERPDGTLSVTDFGHSVLRADTERARDEIAEWLKDRRNLKRFRESQTD